MLDNQKIRYLLIGVLNTLFGYFVTIYLYYSLSGILHTLLLLIIAHILAISFSFVTNKFFVFKSKNKWLLEYFRYYTVYGVLAIFSILLVWILADYTKVPFWIIQLLVLGLMICSTYFAHKVYTFKDI